MCLQRNVQLFISDEGFTIEASLATPEYPPKRNVDLVVSDTEGRNERRCFPIHMLNSNLKT